MARTMPAVEVEFLDGNIVEGRVMEFNIRRNIFHLLTGEAKPAEKAKLIKFEEVRAVYFLKEKDAEERALAPIAFKLMIEFKDGKFLQGSAERYSPDDEGFFIYPDDPESRYDKICINKGAVEKVERRRPVGEMLVEQKKITSEQLEEGLKKQREKRDKKLGSILKEQKSITDEQLEWSLEAQEGKEQKKLGELLIEADHISRQQLDNALETQKGRRAKRLGQTLVELGYIEPNDICITLSSQFDLPWIDLSNKQIDAGIASILPEEVARRLLAVPVEMKGKTLVVAISYLHDPKMGENLKSVTEYDIEMAIAYEGYIDYIINSVHVEKQNT